MDNNNNGGRFKNGNQMWKLVKFPGAPKKYTPEELWAKFLEYMDKNDEYSWAKDDFIKSGPEAGRIVSIDIPNPPSIRMFCLFAGIAESTFNNYRKSTDLNEVALAIEGIILNTQIGGAAVNLYNSNIIARWAGLVDKKEMDIKSELSDDERTDLIKNLLDKIKKD